ncbi:hypothetical protein D3C71_2047070 [compost metagenome]
MSATYNEKHQKQTTTNLNSHCGVLYKLEINQKRGRGYESSKGHQWVSTSVGASEPGNDSSICQSENGILSR